MDIKELVREKVFAEIIAERDGMVLSQHQEIEALSREVDRMVTPQPMSWEALQATQHLSSQLIIPALQAAPRPMQSIVTSRLIEATPCRTRARRSFPTYSESR